MKYETIGGKISEADTFAQLIEHLRLAEEAAYTIGHIYKSGGQDLKGQGFLAIGEMLKMTVVNVTNFATKSIRSSAGYR